MFLVSYMFDDSTKPGNPGGIMLSGAEGDSQQHFPEEAPDDERPSDDADRLGTGFGSDCELQENVESVPLI